MSSKSGVWRPISLRYENLEHRQLLSVSPALVSDINTMEAPNTVEPRYITEVGDDAFFVTRSPAGHELWKTDGTLAGTVHVKDIPVSHVDSSSRDWPRNLTAAGNNLFFTVQSGQGQDLWRSDGSANGTTRIAEFAEADTYGRAIRELTDVDGTLYFSAFDQDGGDELWKSDGTEAGTMLVKDFPSDSTDVYLADVTSVNGNVFFSVDNPRLGDQLWMSDGTELGTVLVMNFEAQRIEEAVDMAGTLFFQVDKQIWKSDGTEEGTVEISRHSSSISHLTILDQTLYYIAETDLGRGVLWSSDGTDQGTQRILSLDGLYPEYLTVAGNNLYFSIFSGNSTSLWQSDGTAAGTERVRSSSNVHQLTAVGETLFFLAGGGSQVWATDGTDEGARRVDDLPTRNVEFRSLTAVDGKLLFSSHSPDVGYAVGAADSADLAAAPIWNPPPGTSGSDPQAMIAFNDDVFFLARDDEDFRYHLWKTDATSTGTTRISNVPVGATWRPSFVGRFGPDTIYELATANNRLFFVGDHETFGVELFQTDGTPEGTALVKDLMPGNEDSNPRNLIEFKGSLYFTIRGELGPELWKTDGTEAGTELVKRLPTPVRGSGADPRNFVLFNDHLFFSSAIHGGEHAGLWTSDGTEVGTTIVNRISEESQGSFTLGIGARSCFFEDTSCRPISTTHLR